MLTRSDDAHDAAARSAVRPNAEGRGAELEGELARHADRSAHAPVVEAPSEPPPQPPSDGVTLAGRVLAPDGAPAAEAAVVLGATGALQFIEAGVEPPPDLVWTRAAADGRFTLRVPSTGAALLTAGAAGSAPSESLLLDPADGARDDLVLQLRAGVRIHGEVLRPDGSLAKARKVRFLQNVADDAPGTKRLRRDIETDEQGRFDERHLCPGSWGLVSFPDDDERAELGLGDSMVEHMLQATVELEDREESFVVLGGRSATAVVVSGHVTSNAGPAGSLLQWIGECADPMGSQKLARVEKDGSYSVELPMPGAWYVRALGSGAHEEFHVDIPARAEHELDFHVHTGGVRGRVVDAGGAPVAGAVVTHVLVEGAAHRIGFSVTGDRDTTEDDGAFHLTGLSPGRYTIGATHAEHGLAAIGAVRVGDDETLEGVELVLTSGAALEGTVRGADGLPAPGVPVWLHDERGVLLNPISLIRTDKEGRFTTPGLAPGRYAVLTRAGLDVARADVLVEPDAAPRVELDLAPGAVLIVETTAGAQPLRAHVRVHDLDGRLFTGLRCAHDPWAWQRLPFDSLRRHIGPLPPGTYTVSSHVPGRGARAREVTVVPGEELSVAVRF